MDSLYGGHPATEFSIKASFKSVAEMIASFKNGPDYTDVWYNEYCIIDTPNKNDADNGKLYRRGFNYQNNMGGAIEVAQIVGPSSGTPYFSLGNISQVISISEETIPNDKYTYRRFPTGKDSNGNYTTSESGGIATFDFGSPESLIPGKDENGNFNDTIKYTWCNVRADDADADSWFYVGWQMPYLTVEYDIHSESPYDSSGIRKTDPTTVKRVDDKTHPFFEEWDLGLPHGIKGDAIRNLKVITPTSGQKIYPYSALAINSSTGVATIDTSSANYDGFNDDVTNKHQIIVFEYYAYDNKINPDPYLIYVGDFNIVKSIKVSDDGTLTVSYTSQTDSVQSKLVKWINTVSLTTTEGSTGGVFTVTYNNGAPQFQTQLQWIKDITIADNGDVTYTFVGANTRTESHKLKWLDDVTLDEDTGHMVVTFNNDAFGTNTYELAWVKDISITDNGTITLSYTGGKSNATLATKLKNILSARASDDGVVTFTYNTGETINLLQSTGSGNFKLKRVDNISLSSDLYEDKHIKVKYNTESQAINIGDSINHIKNMVVRPSDWHLLVLFSDPAHRYPTVTSTGITWVPGSDLRGLNTDASNPVIADEQELQSNIYWRDFGTIKDQSGILIGFNLSYERITADGYTEPLAWLNAKIPNGLSGDQNELGGISTVGKVVAYTPQITTANPNPGCEFYAYDYQSAENGGHIWFYIGTISDDGSRDVAFSTSDKTAIDNAAQKLNTKGLLFVKYTASIGDDLGQFWSASYTG